MQQIQVLENFGGALTNDRRILPGVYVVGDPALFGLEGYLVELRKAVYLDPEPADDVELIASSEALVAVDYDGDPENNLGGDALRDLGAQDRDYERWTLDDLQAECVNRGFELDGLTGTGKSGRLVKADLINVLEGDDWHKRASQE